jgi:hypothetical protein
LTSTADGSSLGRIDPTPEVVMIVSSYTHTCPYCELVFEYHEEVKDHVIRDHPDHAAVVALLEVHELPHR